MLSNTLELTLRKALSIASDYKHEYATYEHLLLALTEDQDAIDFFHINKINISKISRKLSSYIQKDLAEIVNNNVRESKPTAGFQRIIQRAALHNQAHGQKIINGADLLLSFFFEQESFALECLKAANVKKSDILDYKKNSIHKKRDKDQQIDINSNNFPPQPNSSVLKSSIDELSFKLKPENTEIQPSDAQNELEKYCVNLNTKANKSDIDCLIGRQNEIQRTIEILCRRKKNNAILVGEPGVGKTAIAEGLATRIVNGDVPNILKNSVIYSLDIGSLVAGTKFRGDFEERIKIMLECLKRLPNAILFIDEIHSIIGAGSTSNGSLDASNLLKPALANGTLKCIGSTTFKEYHNHFEKDMALVRRFQKITIEEPDEESTFKILQGLKGYYEDHHNVCYTDAALKSAITLSERYINDRNLPDKAIDLIDEAGAKIKTSKNVKKKVTITEKEIEALISSIINIPNIQLEVDDIKQIKALEGKLKNTIFGQDEAIESLCASIKLSKAGLKKVSRPTGCYLFVGTTGVGKTELAKQLAFFCNMKLLKYDMSEFSESSSISKLVGSAPGYVGFDQGGMLTEEVSKYPYSVVLLDEIEKAHHEIYNLLLQVMDEGTLTDSTGKKVKFSHTIIILTSNALKENHTNSIGFNDGEKSEKIPKFDISSIDDTFSPEFRSRLDKIIIFNPIDGIIDKIIDKNLKDLAAQLADKKVVINVSQAVKKYFAESCFKEQNGARILDRVIDTEIKQYIADAILFGKLKKGGFVDIDYSKTTQKLVFKFTGLDKKNKQEFEPS